MVSIQAHFACSWKPVPTHMPLLCVWLQTVTWSAVGPGSCPTAAVFRCPVTGFWWGRERQADRDAARRRNNCSRVSEGWQWASSAVAVADSHQPSWFKPGNLPLALWSVSTLSACPRRPPDAFRPSNFLKAGWREHHLWYCRQEDFSPAIHLFLIFRAGCPSECPSWGHRFRQGTRRRFALCL